MHVFRLISLCAIIALAATVWAQSGRVYIDPRFGVEALVPGDWIDGPNPANGDGKVFASVDGQARELVYGVSRKAGIAEDIDRLSTPLVGETITYLKRGKKAVALSGLKGGRIFYRRAVLSCNDSVWAHVALDYPVAQKEDYDALVTRVAGSLRGRACE
jgi:serine/threonine-protein kinase